MPHCNIVTLLWSGSGLKENPPFSSYVSYDQLRTFAAAPRHLTQHFAHCRCHQSSRSPRKLLPGKANFAGRARKLTFHNKTDFEKSISILAVRAPTSFLRLFYGRSNNQPKTYLVSVAFASALHYEQVHRIACGDRPLDQMERYSSL